MAATTDDFALALVVVVAVLLALGLIVSWATIRREWPEEPPSPPEPFSLEEWQRRADESQRRSHERRT